MNSTPSIFLDSMAAADESDDLWSNIVDADNFVAFTESMADESCSDALRDYTLGFYESEDFQKKIYTEVVEARNRADMQLKRVQYTLTRLKKLKSSGCASGTELHIEAQDLHAGVVYARTCLFARKKRTEYLEAQVELAKKEAESARADMNEKSKEVEAVAMANS